MDCRDFEDRLEALLDGALDEHERRCCERHLAACGRCRELAETLAAAAPPPDDLLGAVLARTSGPACASAESRLCAWLDGELAGADRELMGAHLESCADCRALAAAMTRLAAELPWLAELRPDPGFVAAVLAATLPVQVRLRRWWAAVWPRWVRRPRFASEAAFIATMVLVLVFATPGSPLEAVPTKALGLAKTNPTVRLEAPLAALEEQFSARVTTPIGSRYARAESRARAWAQAWAEEAEARGRGLVETVGTWLGTCRELAASLLGSADDTAFDDQDAKSNPTEETP
jgi:predicted anti-sigma-YlaC factor YlaD